MDLHGQSRIEPQKKIQGAGIGQRAVGNGQERFLDGRELQDDC